MQTLQQLGLECHAVSDPYSAMTELLAAKANFRGVVLSLQSLYREEIAIVRTLKRRLPHAITLAHPECPANIREHSDFVGGTEAMLQYVAGFKEPTDFLVATEANMMWQLQSKFPQHRFHPVPGITCACNKCPHMGLNTLEKLRDCLINEAPEIAWEPTFAQARGVLERSLLK